MRRSLLQLLNIPCYLDTDARILIRILVTRQGMQSGGVAMCFSVRIDRGALGDVMSTAQAHACVPPYSTSPAHSLNKKFSCALTHSSSAFAQFMPL